MKPENRPKITYEGKQYDDYQATQMQRRIEREIRKQARLKNAYQSAGLTEDAKNANIRLRQLNGKYREFSAAAGLPEQRERTRVLYVDDTSTKTAAKVLAKQMRSDIMAPKRTNEVPVF